MNNYNPPIDPNPNPQNCYENNHPRQWPPQSTMAQPQAPQMQQQNNWNCPPSIHSQSHFYPQQFQQMHSHHQQRFQHSSGQCAPIPLRYIHPPPPVVWQHQHYPQHQQQNPNYIQQPKFELSNHHQQQQNDNLSSQELRRLLNAQQEQNKELIKVKNDLEEQASKALATARMYEMKMAKAYEEIGKMRSELARMEILTRTAEKECQEKQQKLDKMEAEMQENKKKKLILRTKRELQKPPVPPTFDKIDEIIQAMGKTTAKTPQPVKKVVDGTGQGKKQQPQQCNNGPDSDYAPPGAKKERIALQNNANRSQPIINSISYCAPSTSSKSPSKKPTQLHKSFGDEALIKIGAPPYVRRTFGAPPSTAQSTANVVGQLKEQNNDLEQYKETNCEHWYSADCDKCKQRYGI